MSGNCQIPDWKNIYKYPTSKLLGNFPCGKEKNKYTYLNRVLPGIMPYNIPTYPDAPNENCNSGLDNIKYRSCTPKLRFKDGDNDLAMSRVRLRQLNNVPFLIIPESYCENDPNFDCDDNSSIISENACGIIENSTPMTQILNIDLLQAMGGSAIRIGGQTPFRALMNAGDPNLSYNKYTTTEKKWLVGSQYFITLNKIYCSESNQVSSTRRASNAAAVRMSGIMPTLTPNFNENIADVSLWSGNQKWVYDGSDYVTFKKLQAKNRNYNDSSWGGDRGNAAQAALSRVRH